MRIRGPIFAAVLSLSALGNLPCAHAAPAPSNPSENDLLYRGVLESQKNALESRKSNLAEIIRRKTRTYHSLENSPVAPRFVWEESLKTPEDRKRLARLLKIQIQQHLDELNHLATDSERVQAELEWFDVQKRESITIPTLSENATLPTSGKGHFRCDALPFKPLEGQALELVQDFGRRRDQDTGIEWQSLGWWVGHVSNSVQVCQPGTVVFVGKVAGRGRVVLVEHSGGFMTLYANLADDPSIKLTKGAHVVRGQQLGTPLDRAYFEVRSAAGEALNPRLVMTREQLGSL